jgi:hypothetical protein
MSRARCHLAFVALASLLFAARAPAQFVNGSFETGDFTGWVTQDLEDPLQALDTSSEGGFTVPHPPTDGVVCATTGFDGAGPGTIFLAQDVTVPADKTTLLFDYFGGWDLADFGAEVDRDFSAIVEPSGGGSPLQTTVIRTAVAGTLVDDTGVTTASVDLSAFAGQDVRVKFAWDVPEDYTGPGGFALDNVRLVGKKLPGASAASLKVKLDFVNEDADSLGFSMVVPVSEDFAPEDEDVSVTIGDASFDFTLDATGNAVEPDDGQSLSVKPAGAAARKVTLHCAQADLLPDLSDYGLDNVDTGPSGVYCAVPVSVELDGEVTTRTLAVLYKAVEDVKGSGAGKVSSELRTGKLLARLDFATPDSDSLTFKGLGVVEPGFSPEGATVTVSLGSLTREFTLDAAGKGQAEDSTLVLKRDKSNPAFYAVTLSCPQGDLAGTLAADGFTNANAPKPGVSVPLVLTITLDGRVMQSFFVAKWAATQDLFGVAHAKF